MPVPQPPSQAPQPRRESFDPDAYAALRALVEKSTPIGWRHDARCDTSQHTCHDDAPDDPAAYMNPACRRAWERSKVTRNRHVDEIMRAVDGLRPCPTVSGAAVREFEERIERALEGAGMVYEGDDACLDRPTLDWLLSEYRAQFAGVLAPPPGGPGCRREDCSPADQCSFCGCCQHTPRAHECKANLAPRRMACPVRACGCQGRS